MYSEGFNNNGRFMPQQSSSSNNQSGIMPPQNRIPEGENSQGNNDLLDKMMKYMLLMQMGNFGGAVAPMGGGMLDGAMQGATLGGMISEAFGGKGKTGAMIGGGLGLLKGFADGGFGGNDY